MTNAYGYCRFSSDRQNECSIEPKRTLLKFMRKTKDIILLIGIVTVLYPVKQPITDQNF